MVVLRSFHRLASAALAVLLLPLVAAAPELLDLSEATVFVDGDTDYFEFANGNFDSIGTTWTLVAPDSSAMTFSKTTGGEDAEAQRWTLDGTRVSGSAGWTSEGDLSGSAADGTWSILVTGFYNSIDATSPNLSPGPTLAVQGKSIHFNGAGWFPNLMVQTWNWHMTTGTWSEPFDSISDLPNQSPEEDPQFARFFAWMGGPVARSIPGASDSETLPGQDIDTPPFTIPATCPVTQCTAETPLGSTPPVTLPATCTVGPCTAETPLVTPAQPVPETCVPPLVPLLCVGPFTVPSLDLGDAPAICATAGVVCLGPIPIPAQDLGSAPAVCDAAGEVCVGPFPVPAQDVVETEDVTVAVDFTGLDAAADAHEGEIGSFGPIVEVVPVPLIGDVPVTLCPATCPFPVTPEGETVGSVTVTVTVGDEEESYTIPLGTSI